MTPCPLLFGQPSVLQNRRMKWRHTTRGTAVLNKIGDTSSEVPGDEDQFTSSSEEEDAVIDVVTDN